MTSQVHMHMGGRTAVKRGPVRLAADAQITTQDLRNIGVNVSLAMDALQGGGAGGVPGYVSREALETWLPGTLRAITAVRTIDEIAGISTIGRWEDEAIRLRMVEPSGHPELYGDNANIPLADIRTTVEARGVVRFEQGFQVGRLEDARLSASGYRAAEEKRRAASESLDVARNSIGFFGFSSAETQVYGLLNDPNLSAYKSYSETGDGAGGVAWNDGALTFEDMVKDFTRMVDTLEDQMGGHLFDRTPLTFVIPTGYRNVLQVHQQYTSVSFHEWMRQTYPGIRVITTPEFKKANGTSDVAYLIADAVGDYDDSDINGATLIQAVPTRYEVLGSENGIKGYVEDAVMATAGVFVLRPWAIARYNITA